MMDEERENFRDLAAWQSAMDFVELVYAFTGEWTTDEPFGMRAQVRSAVVSVPAYFAKGHGMFSPRDFAHHLRNAHDGVTEVETLVRFESRSNQPSESELESISRSADRIRRQIGQMLSSLDLSVPN